VRWYTFASGLCDDESLVLHEQMIDALVAAAGPLPTEYANRKQTLLCNDCEVCLSYTAGQRHA
jgi:hypothetical protein